MVWNAWTCSCCGIWSYHRFVVETFNCEIRKFPFGILYVVYLILLLVKVLMQSFIIIWATCFAFVWWFHNLWKTFSVYRIIICSCSHTWVCFINPYFIYWVKVWFMSCIFVIVIGAMFILQSLFSLVSLPLSSTNCTVLLVSWSFLH